VVTRGVCPASTPGHRWAPSPVCRLLRRWPGCVAAEKRNIV